MLLYCCPLFIFVGGQIVSGARYERVGQGSLRIRNLTVEDGGVYKCNVTQGDTELTGQVTLRVIGK